MKKWFLSLTVIALGTAGLFAPTSASAKTTYLPHTIRHHTFYRLTDGAQGGFHDKTTFTGNRMRVGHWTWRLTHVRKQNAKTYFATLHYTKRRAEPIKIKVFSAKHFDFVPKHILHLKGAYTGNEQYGATIFKR